MKRSEINVCLREFLEFSAAQRFCLPPWARWTPEQWSKLGPEADEIRRAGLGWDVTDFGSGRFDKMGLTLFTLRNGLPNQSPGPAEAGQKDFCEKVMMVRPEQVTPMHFHFSKMEDIINRGGGDLVIKLHHSTDDEQLDRDRKVTVQVDGITRTLPPGGELILAPGESVTLVPYLYHEFWARAGGGPALVGEVSRVNDDTRDNRFLRPLPRFPAIEEDEPPQFVLCNEYPPAAV